MLLYILRRLWLMRVPERVACEQARVWYLTDPEMEKSSPASLIKLNLMPEQEGQNPFEPRFRGRRVPLENFGRRGLPRRMRRYDAFHINLGIHEPNVRAVNTEIDCLSSAVGILSYMQAALLQEHGCLICHARLL